MVSSLLIVFVVIALLSYAGVFLVRRWLARRQVIDIPNERSSHSTPIPRGGGIVMVLAVLITVLIAAALTGAWRQGLVFVILGSFIAYLGWRDDVHSLSSRVRILLQAVVAILTMVGLGYFSSVTVPMLGEFHMGIFGTVITFLWIVGATNAFNFMDGIDGIAGGVALAGGFSWVILSLAIGLPGNMMVLWVALAIAASSLGFLGHNWSPARIFMGDVASTFLGYTFAVLPLLFTTRGGDALMFGVVILWAFILDASVTFIRRALRHEPVFSAHRQHLYQKLVISGYPQSTISLLYIFLTFYGGALTLGWLHGYAAIPALMLLGLPAIYALLAWHAHYRNKVNIMTQNTGGPNGPI